MRLKVRRNLSFLVDVSSFKKWEEIKADMNGSFPHQLRIGTWTLRVDSDEVESQHLYMTMNFIYTFTQSTLHLVFALPFSFYRDKMEQ